VPIVIGVSPESFRSASRSPERLSGGRISHKKLSCEKCGLGLTRGGSLRLDCTNEPDRRPYLLAQGSHFPCGSDPHLDYLDFREVIHAKSVPLFRTPEDYETACNNL
jgi:hypothetical protein